MQAVFARRRTLFVLLGVALVAGSLIVWGQRWFGRTIMGLADRVGSDAGTPSPTPSTPLLGDESLAVGLEKGARARELRSDGRSTAPEAFRLASEHAAITRRHLGASAPEAVAAAVLLGLIESDSGRHRDAIARLRNVVQAERQASPLRPGVLSDALDALGTALTKAQYFDEAIPLLEESLSTRRRISPPAPSSAEQLARETLVEARQQTADYGGARVEIERARAVAQGCPCLRLLNLEALQLYFEGEKSASRTTSMTALALAERTLRPDHPDIAITLRVLAGTIDDLGFIDEARRYRERALGIARRSLGERHWEIAGFLNDLGTMESLVGALTEARSRFEEALNIAQASLWPEHEWIAMLVHNLALVDAGLGDLESAAQGQLRAIDLWERTKGRDHAFVAIGLSELAFVRRDQHNYTEALALLQRALEIRQKSLAPNHLDIARTTTEIATILSLLGQPEEAEQRAASALRMWDRPDTRDAPERATVLELNATLHLQRGSLARARQYFRDALAIRRRIFGASHPLVADVQAGLARTEALLGQYATAASVGLDAEHTGREHLRLMIRNLPERQALNYARARPKGLPIILSLVGRGTDAAAALDAVARSRALVLDEMAARHAPVRGEDASQLRVDLANARQRLANLMVRGPVDEEPQQHVTAVVRARAEKERAERALADQNAAFRSELSRSLAGLSDIRSALTADSVLISYVRFERLPLASGQPRSGAARERSARPPSASPGYLAFVLGHGREPEAVDLGAADAIESLVAQWREDIEVSRSRNGARFGKPLREAIWDPLAAHVKDARTIFVVPDGELNLVPLGGLPGQTREFLIEEVGEIHYLSAERDLLVAPAQSRADGLLALGGAAFDAAVAARARPSSRVSGVTGLRAAECEPLDRMQFHPLTATRQEVQEIAGLWRSRGPLRMMLGTEADERSLKRAAPGNRILHLATHGFFLGADCVAGGAGSRAPADGPGAELPPLAGLALAGANGRAGAKADDDDGILTAEEVAGLDLRDVEWAVLSACNTGVGQLQAGEGVLGLRRAFQMAGARTVIMSLWAVDDQATRAWMRTLYESRLNQRLSTAGAVRRASLDMLQARRARGLSTSPFYWSAFVAAGDWR